MIHAQRGLGLGDSQPDRSCSWRYTVATTRDKMLKERSLKEMPHPCLPPAFSSPAGPSHWLYPTSGWKTTEPMGDVDSGQAEKGRERTGVGWAKRYRGVRHMPKRGDYFCNYFLIFQNVPLIDMPPCTKLKLKNNLSLVHLCRKLFN